MDQINHTLLLFLLVGASLVMLKWIETTFILPKQKEFGLVPIKRKKTKVNALRMCSEHIIALNVPGSMAILDENGGCFVCVNHKSKWEFNG